MIHAVLTGPEWSVVEEVGDRHALRQWASVTKPAVALAVLVAVEEGSVALDAPLATGTSVRHLLAHASGLPFEGSAAPIAPGVRRIYSNLGFEVLADVLASSSGMPWQEYVRAAVLEPLGMASAHFQPEHPSGLAAAGLMGSLQDLVALVQAWAAPTLIAPSTWELAVDVAFPGLPGILPGYGEFADNTWGLGVEIRGEKRPHWTGLSNSSATYGHFGQSGSFFWIDPVAQVACCGLDDEPFGLRARRTWPRLADEVLEQLGQRMHEPPV